MFMRFRLTSREHVRTASSLCGEDPDVSVLERAGYRCEIRLPRCQITATRVYVEPTSDGVNGTLRLPQQAACGRCRRTLDQFAAELAIVAYRADDPEVSTQPVDACAAPDRHPVLRADA